MNIAVVGLHFGAEFVPIYRDHPDVGRVGVCDLDVGLMADVADRFGIEDRFSTFDAVLGDERYNAVHLFTPVPLHAEQAEEVLAAGKHCASAVPMATTHEDLTRIVGAQKSSGKNYMLMETAVYDRVFLFVKSMLQRGEFGDLTFLAGHYFQDLEGDFPTYWRGVPPMHYATHSLSPLLALAETRATAVSCFGSGHLRPDIQQPGGNTFPLQCALFRLARRTLPSSSRAPGFKLRARRPRHTASTATFAGSSGSSWTTRTRLFTRSDRFSRSGADGRLPPSA